MKVYRNVRGETSSMTIHDLRPSTRKRLLWFLGVNRPKGALMMKRTGVVRVLKSVNHFLASVYGLPGGGRERGVLVWLVE